MPVSNSVQAFPHTKLSGSGVGHKIQPFTHLTVAGKAGEVYKFTIADILPSYSRVMLGVVAQAVGGSVNIELTLASPDLALNPTQDADLWVSPTEVSPGRLVQLPLIGTAYKITFTSNATLYLIGA